MESDKEYCESIDVESLIADWITKNPETFEHFDQQKPPTIGYATT